MNIEELLKGININQVNNHCGNVSAVNINHYGGSSTTPTAAPAAAASHFPADYRSKAFPTNVGGIAVSLDAIRSMIAQLIVSKLITKKYHWAALQLALESMGLCYDNSSLLADELNSPYWFPELEEKIKPSGNISRYVNFIKENKDLECCQKMRRTSDGLGSTITKEGLESIFALVEYIKKQYNIDDFTK